MFDRPPSDAWDKVTDEARQPRRGHDRPVLPAGRAEPPEVALLKQLVRQTIDQADAVNPFAQAVS
jgi:hypothetical protein